MTFSKLIVSLLESIIIQCNINIIRGFSSDTSIHIQIKSTPVVLIHTEIFVSG